MYVASSWLLSSTRRGDVPDLVRTYAEGIVTGVAWYHLYFLLVTMQVYLLLPVVVWLVRRTRGHHVTVLVVAASFTINPAVRKKLPFDPVRDFTPVTQLVTLPHILVLHPSVPATSVREFIALAKSKPGVLNYGISGIATSTHMAGELFMHMAGIKMVGIPYKGGAPGMTALLGGQIQLYFATISTAIPHIRGGKLRALGVTTAKRSVAAPEYPTIAEAGVPGYEHASWVGMLAPAGVPQKVLSRLNGESAKAVQSQDIRALLLRDGLEAVGNSPLEFGQIIKTEIAKWHKVAKVANIQAQ